MEAVYDGRDVFVLAADRLRKEPLLPSSIIPYDSEKSSSALVVSPLVALKIDQVKSLRSSGVKCSVITSSSDVEKDLLATPSSLSSDSLLFCTPETLVRSKWRNAFDDPVVPGRIVALVIDEPHCEW